MAVAEGVPFARANTLAEFMSDPWALHNEVFMNYHGPQLGGFKPLVVTGNHRIKLRKGQGLRLVPQ